MKNMSLKFKMLLCILPVMAAAMIVLTYIAVQELSTNLQAANTEAMNNNVIASTNSLDGKLDIIRTTAVNISEMVSTSYHFVDMTSYQGTISKIISDNDSILGAGIWFEPNVFNPEETYVGPYWYKDSGQIVETWDYSTAEYDYLSQEYYLNAKALGKAQAKITDPYYDPTSGMVMSSCSAPIYDGDTFVGCVTVDMELSNISEMVSSIKIGRTGRAILLASDGTYIYTDDDKKVQDGVKMTEETDAAIASAGQMIVGNSGSDPKMGVMSENGKTILLTYMDIPQVLWKMVIRMDLEEIEEPSTKATTVLILIAIISLIVGAIIILIFVMSIAKGINCVKEFARVLANGDFTVEKIVCNRGDELGQMSHTLNDMFENNKNVITKIADGSEQVSDTSAGLANMASELSGQFTEIQTNISGVNDAMMSSGAATEQVNASVEEVNASVHQLAAETEKSSQDAVEIKKKARDIEEQSKVAYDNAITIAEQRESDLAEANEKAKVVDQIGTLADTIAEIADQINLLSLNASIEAARAGDAGKGFAVVASEINKLASSTSEAVEQIRETIDGVQQAFGTLSSSSGELLGFIKDTVTPDYDKFVTVAKQYGDDAGSFGDTSEKIAGMVENIRSAMEEVSKAIQNIAESTQDTADLSSRVNDSVMAAADVVSNVNDMAGKQEQVAETLGEIVGQFKLK